MGDSFVNSFVVLCCSSSYSHSLPLSAAFWIDLFGEKGQFLDKPFSQKGFDTPLSPSHAGDKGDSAQENAGLRPVDAVVLPRPSSPRKGREEGKASVSVPSKENTNSTTINGVQIANASVARVTDQLFGYANFSSENVSQEENSTFKWLKRTLYQPQNRSLVGVIGVDKGYPLIADGNAIGDDKEIA